MIDKLEAYTYAFDIQLTKHDRKNLVNRIWGTCDTFILLFECELVFYNIKS